MSLGRLPRSDGIVDLLLLALQGGSSDNRDHADDTDANQIKGDRPGRLCPDEQAGGNEGRQTSDEARSKAVAERNTGETHLCVEQTGDVGRQDSGQSTDPN